MQKLHILNHTLDIQFNMQKKNVIGATMVYKIRYELFQTKNINFISEH